jgi:chemotaxis protein methyltransferase WspC
MVTERAHLLVGNALDSCLLLSEEPFDAILCRNLLIYLTPEARQLVLGNLERLLADYGVLLVGHAEADAFLRGGFRRLRRPGVSVFRKASSHPSGVVLTRAISAMPVPHRPAVPRAGLPAPRPRPTAARSEPSPGPPVASASLESARRLADRGRLDEAIELCESYLEEHRDSAEALFLLSMLHQAMGARGLAEEGLHKVVYLEPDNYQALMCLALLKERRGERTAAAALQRRAGRALERSGHTGQTEGDERDDV